MSTSQPRHGVHLERDTMIPMRDGVRLATDIYLAVPRRRQPARGTSAGTAGTYFIRQDLLGVG